jgi:hypothetical protein
MMIQSVGRHETPKCSVLDGLLGFRSLAQESSPASDKVAATSDKAEVPVLGVSSSSATAPTLGTHEDVTAMGDGYQGAGKIAHPKHLVLGCVLDFDPSRADTAVNRSNLTHSARRQGRDRARLAA